MRVCVCACVHLLKLSHAEVVEYVEPRQGVDDPCAVALLVSERVALHVELAQRRQLLQHLERRLQVLQHVALQLQRLEVTQLLEAARAVDKAGDAVVVHVQVLEPEVVLEPLELGQLVVVEPQHLRAHGGAGSRARAVVVVVVVVVR